MDHLHRIFGLAVKEVQQLSRDRLLLAFLIIGPLLELLLMGSLSGGGVENLPLAVIDQDRTRASRGLIARLDRTDELRVARYGRDVEEARDWMQNGDVAAIAVVPPQYGAALEDPKRTADVQVIADGSHHIVSTVALGTAEDVAAQIARDLASADPRTSKGPVDLRFVARFNAAMEDQPHAITAMLGMIVFQVALVVAAQSIAREREMGTLEQLRVTPLGRLDLMVGKALPTLAIGIVDFLMMMGVIALWFDIPMRGSLLLLTLLTVPFVLVQIGWGTLISLVSRTQQQAMLFVFALAMLEVAFSGFLVPAGNMPPVMEIISYVSSVQHYLVIVRGVALRGAGLNVLWLPGTALVALSLVLTILAWLRLRMGLDSDSLRQRLTPVWRRLRCWLKDVCHRGRGREDVTQREWTREPVEP
jgi:ABC-2 type transport system permease protein